MIPEYVGQCTPNRKSGDDPVWLRIRDAWSHRGIWRGQDTEHAWTKHLREVAAAASADLLGRIEWTILEVVEASSAEELRVLLNEREAHYISLFKRLGGCQYNDDVARGFFGRRADREQYIGFIYGAWTA